jgi:glutamine amidotransferase
MIAVIDYGMGNLRSVVKAFEKVGATAAATRDPSAIRDASHVVLPGVGAFKDCMDNLEALGLVEPVKTSIEDGKPFLGICLGLHLLMDESAEFGVHAGLGVIRGKVRRFPPRGRDGVYLKIPHMGWNEVRKVKDSPLLDGIPQGEYFYFVHSYYAVPDEASVTLTTTAYGEEFTSSIAWRNVFACQFHPEKSQKAGLAVLKNFSALRP